MCFRTYKSNKSSNMTLSTDFVIINGLVLIGITLCFISHMSQLLIYSIHLFSLSNVKKTLIFLHLSFGKYSQKWTFHFNIDSIGKFSRGKNCFIENATEN